MMAIQQSDNLPERSSNQSWRTAIARTAPSAPLSWLVKEGHVMGEVLDFGSGRGFDADYLQCDRYDPHYHPYLPTGKYDTVLCTYVFNVLPKEKEFGLLTQILDLLRKDGTAYVTVRNDLKREGYTSRGTYQRFVDLPYPIIKKTAGFTIFQVFNEG
jgi:hypothetical protein